MPNYIRTTNPWLVAANSMNGVVSPLADMITKVPQIQAQMQHQADQMGLQQARLGLEERQLEGQLPVYLAQEQNYLQSAEKAKQDAAAQAILNALSPQAGQAKRMAVLSEQGFQPGLPTRVNAATMNNADFAGILAQALALDPASAQRALADEQQPIKLNMGQTGFSRSGQPTMQGAMSVPFGNTLLQGSAVGQQPNVLQQGQFRPSLMQQNPAAGANNIANALTGLIDAGLIDPEAPEVANALSAVFSLSSQAGGGTNAPAMRMPTNPSTATTNYPTATNPKTGQKLIFKDGKWTPL